MGVFHQQPYNKQSFAKEYVVLQALVLISHQMAIIACLIKNW